MMMMIRLVPVCDWGRNWPVHLHNPKKNKSKTQTQTRHDDVELEILLCFTQLFISNWQYNSSSTCDHNCQLTTKTNHFSKTWVERMNGSNMPALLPLRNITITQRTVSPSMFRLLFCRLKEDERTRNTFALPPARKWPIHRRENMQDSVVSSAEVVALHAQGILILSVITSVSHPLNMRSSTRTEIVKANANIVTGATVPCVTHVLQGSYWRSYEQFRRNPMLVVLSITQSQTQLASTNHFLQAGTMTCEWT